MKYEEYIKKLDSLNEEFEEGLLLELQEKPPTNLHGEIMKSVTKERKRVNFFNYRIYAPAVAAVLIFAVVINRPEILEKISFIKNARITQEQAILSKQNTNPKENSKEEQVDGITASNENANTEDNQEPKDNKADEKVNDPKDAANNSTGKKDVAINAKDNTTIPNGNGTKTVDEGNSNEANTATDKDATDLEMNDNEDIKSIVSNLWGLAFFKEPEINYEIVLDDNKSAILNFITENYEEKLNTPNTYKLSLEQFENMDKLLNKYGISKKAINGVESSSNRIVKIYFVNYHITINNSAPDVVSFIEDQAKCVKMDDSTYKIATDDMNELDKILSSAGIKKNFISEVEGKYGIFKSFIINYEVNIDSSQNSAVSFIKNTDKCKPMGDNIYRMSRENFNEFKEILNNSNLEFKVLNETNNSSILIKVNNI